MTTNDPAPYGESYAQPNAPMAGPAKTNTLAIIALILGIVIPIGGIICGPIALSQIKRTGESGRGLAKAGLIIGIILTILGIISTIFSIIVLNSAANQLSQTNY